VNGNTSPPATYSMGTDVLFWEQRLRGMKLSSDSPASSVGVKKGWKYTSVFPVYSHGVDKDRSSSLPLKQNSRHLKRLTMLQH